MSNPKEGKLPKYIDFPYDRFMMVRLEYLAICQNELEAKVLRIIEWCIDNERERLNRTHAARAKGKPVTLPEEIWAEIPRSFFMEYLFGTVQSESTLKSIIKSLKKKKLIFNREGGKNRYDGLEYMINKPLLEELFKLLPPIEQLDMISIMKQPRKPRKTKSGEMRGAKIDPLVLKIQETIKNDSGGQKLTPRGAKIDPLRGAKIDPLPELGGGQKLPPIKRYKELEKKGEETEAHNSEEKLEEVIGEQSSPPSSFSDSNQENYPIANKTTDISPSIVSEPPLEPRKGKEPLTTVEQAFEAYDDALRASHIVDSSFKQTPRTKDNIGWMQALIEQGATREGILNAMESLATDCDTFYRKNIRPKFFSENYTTRAGMAEQEKKAQSIPKEKSHKEQELEARRAEWNKWMSPTPSNASL